MILNGCYVSVGLFCTVCNDVYSKMFIFGSIMTRNDYQRFRMARKHLRRRFANFHGWFGAENQLAYTCKIVKRSSVGK